MGSVKRTAIPKPTVRSVLERDKGLCQLGGPRCTRIATECDHRANRGSGGSKVLNDPACLVAACTACNAFWKENTSGRELADLYERGLKVRPHRTHALTLERCRETPIVGIDGVRYQLTSDGRRIAA